MITILMGFSLIKVADMHYGNGRLTRCRDVLDSEFDRCSDLNTSHFLRKMIEAEKPHFIAFTCTFFCFSDIKMFYDFLFVFVFVLVGCLSF